MLTWLALFALFSFLGWCTVASVVGFILMWVDQGLASARNNQGLRIPEVWILLVGLLGGATGVGAGIYTLRHKTLHPIFVGRVGVLFAVQVAIALVWLMITLLV